MVRGLEGKKAILGVAYGIHSRMALGSAPTFKERIVQTILYAMLLAAIVWPIADAGIRWLHSWITFKLETAGMTANAERCSSLNSTSGLCDWGTDCLCWHIHLQQHQAANDTGHVEVYSSPHPPKQLNFTPLTTMNDVVKKPVVVEPDDDYAALWDKPNPGLVPDGTQPVEIETEDGEKFPGFSQYGG